MCWTTAVLGARQTGIQEDISVFLLAGFGAGIYFLHLSFIPVATPGVTTLILLMSFFLAFNTMFLGIIDVNVGRIYNQGKNRPLYLVDEQGNFDEAGGNRHTIWRVTRDAHS